VGGFYAILVAEKDSMYPGSGYMVSQREESVAESVAGNVTHAIELAL